MWLTLRLLAACRCGSAHETRARRRARGAGPSASRRAECSWITKRGWRRGLRRARRTPAGSAVREKSRLDAVALRAGRRRDPASRLLRRLPASSCAAASSPPACACAASPPRGASASPPCAVAIRGCSLYAADRRDARLQRGHQVGHRRAAAGCRRDRDLLARSLALDQRRAPPRGTRRGSCSGSNGPESISISWRAIASSRSETSTSASDDDLVERRGRHDLVGEHERLHDEHAPHAARSATRCSFWRSTTRAIATLPASRIASSISR